MLWLLSCKLQERLLYLNKKFILLGLLDVEIALGVGALLELEEDDPLSGFLQAGQDVVFVVESWAPGTRTV